METELKKLLPGQKLYWVWNDKRRGSEGEEVTVSKVGRKWATLSCGYRISLVDWHGDGAGYTSPGRCFESLEAFTAHKMLLETWQRFQRAVSNTYYPPEGVRISQIENAERALLKTKVTP